MEKVKIIKTLVVLVSVRTVFLVLLVDVKEIFINKAKKKTVDENGRTTVEENIETCSLGFGNRGTTPELQPRTLTIEERIEELERKIDSIRDRNIRDIDTEFNRSVSHEERLEIRLNNLEKELGMLKKYHNLKLLVKCNIWIVYALKQQVRRRRKRIG